MRTWLTLSTSAWARYFRHLTVTGVDSRPENIVAATPSGLKKNSPKAAVRLELCGDVASKERRF